MGTSEENAKLVVKWPAETKISMNKSRCRAFYPGKFYPCRQIYRRDFVILVQEIHVAKIMGGIMSAFTKMSRRDFEREGFCPYPFGSICIVLITPQPLYNTIVWVQANFRVSYQNRVITRVKCIVI